jgi:hypothetical protein
MFALAYGLIWELSLTHLRIFLLEQTARVATLLYVSLTTTDPATSWRSTRSPAEPGRFRSGAAAVLSCNHYCSRREAGIRRPPPLTSKLAHFLITGSSMPRLHNLFLSAATLIFLNIPVVAQTQYYRPAPGYGYSPPPCQAVTPGPFQGAARGAAGGALIGAISGNAGRGAAIGAGFGAARNAVRRGSARSAGACY